MVSLELKSWQSNQTYVDAQHPRVLDTPAILYGYFDTSFLNYTTPEVLKELRKTFSIEFDGTYREALVNVRDSSNKSVKLARETAHRTGDIARLSDTDISVIALALDFSHDASFPPVILSDDFALVNTALHLGLGVDMVRNHSKKFKMIIWQWYCPICARSYPSDSMICQSCGAQLKRRPSKGQGA